MTTVVADTDNETGSRLGPAPSRGPLSMTLRAYIIAAVLEWFRAFRTVIMGILAVLPILLLAGVLAMVAYAIYADITGADPVDPQFR